MRTPTAHNITTSKMAAAFKAGATKDKKGRFCGNGNLKRRKNISATMTGNWSVSRSESSEILVNDTGFRDAFQLRGRRVVELVVLAEALDGGCKACNEPLRLSNCTDETVSGLGSFLYIVCSNSECGETNVCYTNKTHRVTGTRGRPIFDVNTKLAAGVGSMIGIKSGKVIGYGTRTKRCSICEAADRNAKQPRQHDCRLNWSASSKAMEADVCVNLVQACSAKHNTQVTILVGDEDSSTIKKVRDTVNHEVEKWSDIVHAKRSFGSALYSLQSKHKGNLSAKVIEYLQRCFTYALKQNKDTPDGVKSSFGAIIPHAFGDHDTCDISWCGYLKDSSNYSHASLPHGRDLQGDSLKQDLQGIMDIFINNAEKLAPLGSSQANEALNNTIGSKAPKIRHYASSESNDYRVACAVSQKNIGHSYVTQALENIQLSPGTHCQQYSNKMDRKIRQLRARESTREFKRKRRTRKEQRLTKKKQLETREGPQYETGMGYQCSNESGEIPPPYQPPGNKEVSIPEVHTKVVFDLETSSRGSFTKEKSIQLAVMRLPKTLCMREFEGFILYITR